jgi:hypothetical protein
MINNKTGEGILLGRDVLGEVGTGGGGPEMGAAGAGGGLEGGGPILIGGASPSLLKLQAKMLCILLLSIPTEDENPRYIYSFKIDISIPSIVPSGVVGLLRGYSAW